MSYIPFLLLGALMGTLSGLLGIGGGVVVVPGLVWLLDLPIKKAVAMSLTVIVPVAASGVIGHVRHGHLAVQDLKSAALVAAGGIGCAMLGAWLAHILPAPTLKRAFGLLLVVVGIRMVLVPSKPSQPEPAEATQGAAQGAAAPTADS